MALVIVVALLFGLLAAQATAAPLRGSAADSTNAAAKPPTDKAVFFASDGLRQDLVEKYADQGVMPTMSDFLEKGAQTVTVPARSRRAPKKRSAVSLHVGRR